MLKKIVAIVITVGLLGQNLLFAQSTSEKKVPLSTVQKQAQAALASINLSEPAFDATLLTALVASGMIAITALGYVAGKNSGYKKGLEAGTEIGDRKGFRVGYKIGEFDGQQKGWEKALQTRTEFKQLMKSIAEKDPAFYTRLNEAIQFKKSYSLAFSAPENIRLTMKELGLTTQEQDLFLNPEKYPTTSVSFTQKVVPVLKKLAANPGRFSLELMNVLLRRYGLLSVGLLMFATTPAQAQDNSIVNRIVKEPNLFLNANAEGLRLIEQYPAAEDYCRELTAGLQELAAMPSAQRQELLDQVQQQGQKNATKRVQRTVSSVTAR